jgi:DNA repair exonuclease SbcCD ATPase subunit
MRLHSLALRHFRRLDSLELPLAPGLTVIRGPNGVGKSTVLEGMVWALFGAGPQVSGQGAGVRRSEESLRRSNAPAEEATAAELRFEVDGARYQLRRELVSDEGVLVPMAQLRDGGSQLLAAGPDSVTEAVTGLLGAGREAMLHACVTGRRELQQLSHLRPVDRLRTLARLLGRSVSRRVPADAGLLDAAQLLHQEIAAADERMAALASAPDLLVQYSAELDGLRLELASGESLADRLHEQWSQKRQDVDTRLMAASRRLEELGKQLERIGAAGDAAPCPTCGRNLGDAADEVTARLDDELYVVAQDLKWLRQRQAQLARRPAELADVESRRRRLRQAVDDRAERVARCEQAAQELWTVARERQRAVDQLETLGSAPAATGLGSPLSATDLEAVAALAGGFLQAATGGRYETMTLTPEGRVYGFREGAAAPVVSGGDEDLMALALRLATMQLASAAAGQMDFMLVDEPFAALDEARAAAVAGLFRDMAAVRGQVILTTVRDDVAPDAPQFVFPGA